VAPAITTSFGFIIPAVSIIITANREDDNTSSDKKIENPLFYNIYALKAL